MSALSFAAVAHAYGAATVLHEVDLEVAAGELVCLLGPSGCGKSTLLRLAAGLEELQAGRIAIDGRVVAEPGRALPPERRRVGMVFQDFALFPHLNVLDNVGFGLAGRPAAERRARSLELLATIGMAAAGESWPHMLSGGQQQRVALARALAPRPAVVLLDEPFSGLDPTLREHLREEARQLLRATGVTTLMVTHDAEEAMGLADRIAVMQAGRIRAVQTPQQLYFHPADTSVARLFGEVNELPGHLDGARLQTPLGPLALPAGRLPPAFVLLLRPEGVRLTDDGVPAEVVEARLLGRTALLTLRVVPADAAPFRLKARVPSPAMPRPGAHVRVGMEPRLVHLVPGPPGEAQTSSAQRCSIGK